MGDVLRGSRGQQTNTFECCQPLHVAFETRRSITVGQVHKKPLPPCSSPPLAHQLITCLQQATWLKPTSEPSKTHPKWKTQSASTGAEVKKNQRPSPEVRVQPCQQLPLRWRAWKCQSSVHIPTVTDPVRRSSTYSDSKVDRGGSLKVRSIC